MTTEHNVNVMKCMPIYRGKSKDFGQVRFFLINALYFFINLQLYKLHFYPLTIYLYQLWSHIFAQMIT